MNKARAKIALIRTDKIGDLILSLPIDDLLPDAFESLWIVRKGQSWITKASVPERRHFEVDLNRPLSSFWALLQFLRRQEFTHSLHLQAPWWVALATVLAGIPERSGRKSQWFSYLFLNRGIRQSRRTSSQHEAEYNQDLLEKFLHLPKRPLPPLQMQAAKRSQIFERWNLQRKNYVVVHPGMAGSALNWSKEFYQQLIDKISPQCLVVLTGTQNDSIVSESVRAQFADHSRVLDLCGQLGNEDWVNILNGAKVIVGPSTGVLHLGASLGVPVVGLYSPVQVQKASRWGPRGLHVLTLTPKVSCPGVTDCLGANCEQYCCMRQVTPDQAFKAMAPWLAKSA